MYKQHFRAGLTFGFGLMILALAWRTLSAFAQPDAAPLAAVRERLEAAGSYRLRAEITQLLTPQATTAMIGEQEQRQTFHAEGAVALPDRSTLSLRRSDRPLDPPITLVNHAGRTFVQQGDKLVAPPEQNAALPLANISLQAFFDAATNVESFPGEGGAARRYTFMIDLTKLRAQQPAAQLAALDGTQGRGELWVDAEGLPLRQRLTLDVPTGGDAFAAQVQLDMDFLDIGKVNSLPQPTQQPDGSWKLTQYDVQPAPPDSGWDIPHTLALAGHLPPSGHLLALAWMLLLLALLVAAACRHLRRTTRALALVLCALLASQPVLLPGDVGGLRAKAAHAAEQRDVEQIARQAVAQAQAQQSAVSSSGDPNSCGTGSTVTDSDGDGLSDFAERCIGTDPESVDSDEDAVNDKAELDGMVVGSKQWTSDPLNPDTNGDGRPDTVEWPLPYGTASVSDFDNDGVPNIWDLDDDGDDVNDDLDLSPTSRSSFKPNFTLQLNGEGSFDGVTYVDVQLRTRRPGLMRYGLSALDWPLDTAGQIKDLDDSPNDMRLVPMLEISTTQATSLYKEYGVAIQRDDKKQVEKIYVPLQQVEQHGRVDALGGRVAYVGAEANTVSWDARIIWLLQATVDSWVDCRGKKNDPPSAQNCDLNAETTVVQSYGGEDFRLTGLEVTRSRKAEVGVFATPDSPNEDNILHELIIGMNQTYLTAEKLEGQFVGRSMLQEVKARLDSNSVPVEQKFNISERVVSQIRQYPHLDEALADTTSTQVPNFLDANGYSQMPSEKQCRRSDGSQVLCAMLLIGTESQSGQDGMPESLGAPTQLAFNLQSDEFALATTRSMQLAMYRYEEGRWQGLSMPEAMALISARYDYVALAEQSQSILAGVTAEDLQYWTYAFYIAWFSGRYTTVAYDENLYVPPSVSTVPVKGLNGPVRTLFRLPITVQNIVKSWATIQGGIGARASASRGMNSLFVINGMSRFVAGVTSFALLATQIAVVGCSVSKECDERALTLALISISGVVRVASLTYELSGTALRFWAYVNSASTGMNAAARTAQRLTIFANEGALASKFIEKMSRSANTLKIIAVVSLVVDIGLIWTSFGLMAKAGVSGYALKEAIAQAVVATVMAIVMYLLTFVPGGGLVSAIIGLVDLILMATSLGRFSLNKAIAELFYDPDLLSRPKGLSFVGPAISGLKKPELGLVAGNRFIVGDRFRLSFDLLDSAAGGRTKGYGYFDAESDATLTTITSSYKQPTCTESTDGKTKDCENTAQVEIAMREARRNIEATIRWYAEFNYELSECSVGVCGIRLITEKLDDEKQSIDATLDVLPSSLDELLVWSEINNPDRDSDGLSDIQEASYGTEVRDWDSDLDGLSDSFELGLASSLSQGANLHTTDPTKADSDGDGLSDGEELRAGTDPTNADSDGDGLGDGEEVARVVNGQLVGGWTLRLLYVPPVRVFSNPLRADADYDGLNDAAEKANGTSLNGTNEAPTLHLSVEPLRTAPDGTTGVALRAGDPLTITLQLASFGQALVSGTLELCLPTELIDVQGGALTRISGNGSVAGPQREGPSAQACGSRYSWQVGSLLAGEALTTSFRARLSPALTTTTVLSVSASLPYRDAGIQSVSRIQVDGDLPEVQISAPEAGAILRGASYVLGGTASDAGSWVERVELTLPGAGITATNGLSPWAFSWALPADGVHPITARAFDATGQVSAPRNITVTVDNTPPSITTALADNSFLTGVDPATRVVTLTGSAADNLSGLKLLEISLNGAPWRSISLLSDGPRSYAWSYPWKLDADAQGSHTLELRATDRAGNQSSVLRRTLIVDAVAPANELTTRAYQASTPPTLRAGQPLTLTGYANDAGNVPLPLRPRSELLGNVATVPTATVWLEFPRASDSLSVTTAWLGDVNGDGLGDLAVGMPNANGDTGRVSIVYGKGGDWNAAPLANALADSRSSFVGRTGARLGTQIAPAGDVNGDGLFDLLIGDPVNNRLFLLPGRPGSWGQDIVLDIQRRSEWLLLRAPTGMRLGSWQAAAGDVNGDGFDDLLVGTTPTSGTGQGQLYLLAGQRSERWPSQVPVDEVAVATLPFPNAGAPASGVGDVDDDGYADFVLGDPTAQLSTTAGLYLFRGSMAYTLDPTAGAQSIALNAALTRFATAPGGATSVAALGDVNGDGLDDFLYRHGASEVRLVVGRKHNNWASTFAFTGYGPSLDGFLAAAGDVNGDGLNDILLGGLSNGQRNAYLFHGTRAQPLRPLLDATFSGVIGAASAPYAAGADLNCDASSDLLLVPVETAGDGLLPPGLSYGEDAPPSLAALPRTGASITVDGPLGAALTSSQAPPALPAGARPVSNWLYVDDDYCQGCANDGQRWGQNAFGSIQDAVNVAASNTQIVVRPGVYAPFTISGTATLTQNVWVTGVNPDAVFIEGDDPDGLKWVFGITLRGISGGGLSGLTVRNTLMGLRLENAGVGGELDPNRRLIVERLLFSRFTAAVSMSRSSTLLLRRSTMAGQRNTGEAIIQVDNTPDPAYQGRWTTLEDITGTVVADSSIAADGGKVYALLGPEARPQYNDIARLIVRYTPGTGWERMNAPASGELPQPPVECGQLTNMVVLSTTVVVSNVLYAGHTLTCSLRNINGPTQLWGGWNNGGINVSWEAKGVGGQSSALGLAAIVVSRNFGANQPYNTYSHRLFMSTTGSTQFWGYGNPNGTGIQLPAHALDALAPLPGIPGPGHTLLAPEPTLDYLYALRGGGRDFYMYSIGTNSWTTRAQTPFDIGAGAGLVWDGGNYFYATAGGNSRKFARYNIDYNFWELLPDLPFAVGPGGGLARIGTSFYLLAGNGTPTFARYDLVLPPSQPKLRIESNVFVASNEARKNWIADIWYTQPRYDFGLAYDFGNRFVQAPGGTTWSPPPYGLVLTPTAAAFVNPAQGVYRVGATSELTASGYYRYAPPATVSPEFAAGQPNDGLLWGQTAFNSIQAAIDAGAQRISLRPGQYREPFYLVSGLELNGAGADSTVLSMAPGSNAGSLIDAGGVYGARLSRLTLAGNGSVDGLRASGAQLSLSRSIVRDASVGVRLRASGSDVEIVNSSFARNRVGVEAQGAPVDVRNTAFAFHTTAALSYTSAPSLTILHPYNAFWQNAANYRVNNALQEVPQAGVVVGDPLFRDPSANDFRPQAGSPLLAAGSPSDPTPPGTGGRVDIGYLQQGRAAVYVDDSYGPGQPNDGLEWGVDAFSRIQNALDAAAVLARTSPVPVTVGVGAGVYTETLTLPSRVHLVGSGPAQTIVIGAGQDAITLRGATDVVISGLQATTVNTTTAAAVAVIESSRAITISRSLLRGAGDGLRVQGGSQATVQFSTLVSNTNGVRIFTGSGGSVANSIIVDNDRGFIVRGSLESQFNLLRNRTENYGTALSGSILRGADDLLDVDPRFVNAAARDYRLQPGSPAADSADPFTPVPAGGGQRADRGFAEIASVPLALLPGKEGISCQVGNSGLKQVDLAAVRIGNASQPITQTLPQTSEWRTIIVTTTRPVASYWNGQITPGADGLYRLYGRAADAAGNSSAGTSLYLGSFVADQAAPAVRWVTPPAASVNGSAVALVADANDYLDLGGEWQFTAREPVFEVISGTQVMTIPATWDDSGWDLTARTPRRFTAIVPIPLATVQVRALARDQAGNLGSTPAQATTGTNSNSATIAAPAAGSATSAMSLTVAGYASFAANPAAPLVQLSRSGGGQPTVVYTPTLANPGAAQSAWASELLLPADGVYTLSVQAARGAALGTTHSITVTRDSVSPTLTITPQTGVVSNSVIFQGTASDATSGVAQVELSLDNGFSWEPARLLGASWSYLWQPPADLDKLPYEVYVRASDRAGNRLLATQSITVDTRLPAALNAVVDRPTGSYIDSGADERLNLSWTAPNEADVSLYLIVNRAPTFTVEAGMGQLLTGSSTQVRFPTPGAQYLHLAAIDAAGNRVQESFGPFYAGGSHDLQIQVDGQLRRDAGEWLPTMRLDDDERPQPLRATQELYGAWDLFGFYLGWQGAHWTLDGAMVAYLGVGDVGTTLALTGVTSPSLNLPFKARYAAVITPTASGEVTGTLYESNGGAWAVSSLNSLWRWRHDPNQGGTEIFLPAHANGSTNVRLLVLAVQNGTAWSVFPTTNPLAGPLSSSYAWSSLGSEGPSRNNLAIGAQPKARNLLLDASSTPALVGATSTITYLLDVSSAESSATLAPQLLLSNTDGLRYTGLSGISCTTCAAGASNWSIPLGNLAPGQSLLLTVTAEAPSLSNLATVSSTLALSVEGRVAAGASLATKVDGEAPTLAINGGDKPAILPGSQLISGQADDGAGGGVAQVRVRVGGGAWQPANGTVAWSIPISVPSVTSLLVEAQALDRLGTLSTVVSRTFVVDSVAPTATLALAQAYSGTSTMLGGTALDSLPNNGTIANVELQIGDENAAWQSASTLFTTTMGYGWRYFWALPNVDRASYRLRVRASDQAGNVGQPTAWQTTTIDTVTPLLTVTTALTQVTLSSSSVAVLSGTVSDGSSVALVADVYDPAGTLATQPLNTSGGAWSFRLGGGTLRGGNYRLQLRAVDAFGNTTTSLPYDVAVVVANNKPSQISLQPASVAENAPVGTIVGTLATSDTDAGDTHTYTLVGGAGDANNLSFSIVSNTLRTAALFDYETTPTATIRLRSSDGAGDFVDQALVISITNTNDAPVAVDDSYATDDDTVLHGNVLANDGDADTGDTLTATLSTQPTSGTLTLLPGGAFTYTPTAGTSGTITFSYVVSDGLAYSNQANVTITVTKAPALGAPSALSLNATPGRVVLAWDAPRDARVTQLQLHRVIASGPSEILATLPVTQTSFVDLLTATGGTSVTYRLQSQSDGGRISAFVSALGFLPRPLAPNTEQDGLLRVELANYQQQRSVSGIAWQPVLTTSVASALAARPNRGLLLETSRLEQSPRLDIPVIITATGIYYVHAFMFAPDASSDSIHLGVNGQVQSSADRLISAKRGVWHWTNRTADGPTATLTITQTGVQTISVWMREDGVLLSELLLVAARTVNTPQAPLPAQHNLIAIDAARPAVRANRGGWAWTTNARSGAQGAGAFAALPDIGGFHDQNLSRVPELSYPISVTTPGTYTVWARLWAPDGQGDSIHVGLNGQIQDSADRLAGSKRQAWHWSRTTLDGPAATLTITQTGVQTISVWMREDGIILDELLLVRNGTTSEPVEAVEALGDTLVLEAEQAATWRSQAGQGWTTRAISGALGSAVEAVPDRGSNFDTNMATAPELSYPIILSKTGVYTVWVRMWAPDGGGDSLHLGLDGVAQPAAARLTSTQLKAWHWTKRTLNGPSATLSVSTPGAHTLNVWLREDGVVIDRIILTQDPRFVPSGG